LGAWRLHLLDIWRGTAPGENASQVVGVTRWKRRFDLVIASALLAMLSPLIACLALLVRLDSPGPALYRQERVGRHGHRFRIWKFRSMYVNSDPAPHHQLAAAGLVKSRYRWPSLNMTLLSLPVYSTRNPCRSASLKLGDFGLITGYSCETTRRWRSLSSCNSAFGSAHS